MTTAAKLMLHWQTLSYSRELSSIVQTKGFTWCNLNEGGCDTLPTFGRPQHGIRVLGSMLGSCIRSCAFLCGRRFHLASRLRLELFCSVVERPAKHDAQLKHAPTRTAARHKVISSARKGRSCRKTNSKASPHRSRSALSNRPLNNVR